MSVTGWLPGANVISETRKARANADVMAFLAEVNSADMFVSALTLGELRKGVEAKRRTDSAAAASLSAWVDGIETTFADRVLAIDAPVARRWGELSAARSVPVVDTLIAATGVATHDPWTTRSGAQGT